MEELFTRSIMLSLKFLLRYDMYSMPMGVRKNKVCAKCVVFAALVFSPEEVKREALKNT